MFILVVLVCLPGVARAADSACARVQIEIAQEMTLERVAFDAKLVIHNKIPDKDLTDIRVEVTITDEAGAPHNDLFFIKLTSQDNIVETGSDGSAVNGDGVVAANNSAEIHWLIIPSPGAGGEDAAGRKYRVGANFTYSIDGQPELLPISPDSITVRPTAQLYLDYFMPRQVIGDNPFTRETEAPRPFPLAVRVLNDGFGPANKLRIDSAQPKIVANSQGLLVDFRLLGASVNDQPVLPSLTVDLGNLASKAVSTATWQMISTLSGRFTEFDVSFSHSDELGGELTSLVKETNPYYLVHMIKVNRPDRDDRLDFLADTDDDARHKPDRIFESEIRPGGTDRSASFLDINELQILSAPERPTAEKPDVDIALNLGSMPPNGWIFCSFADPSQGLLKLKDVVRSDGVHLDPNNFWVDEGFDDNFQPTHTLMFVDYREPGTPGGYTLVFEPPGDDLIPPTTRLVFNGPVVTMGETCLVTPQTNILFVASDNEGGSGIQEMRKKLVGVDTDFQPALPFKLADIGAHTLEFQAVDRALNVEPLQSVTLLVDDAAPVIDAFAVNPTVFAPGAPAGIAAQREVSLVLTASDATAQTLPTTFDISVNGKVVRSLKAEAVPGTGLTVVWDGRDANGKVVGEGDYTVTVSVSDGLDDPANPNAPPHHAMATAQVAVSGWVRERPLDPVVGANQQHPAISGTLVVWQDDRNGNWDIYARDASSTDSSLQLTSNTASQAWPDIDGNLVVWQDNRNGDWDIYRSFADAPGEQVVYSGPGDQERPVVSGNWVAWQDNRNGNWDIYAVDLSDPDGKVRAITSHERDQLHPALAGSMLVWEDYRHGLAEIYQVDLAAIAAGGDVADLEQRLTFDLETQTGPVIDNGVILWTDRRDGGREIYRFGDQGQALRLTYGEGERFGADLSGNLVVYTDTSAGSTDPNLAYLDISTGSSAVLSSHLARQEEPAVGSGPVVWQDNRDGNWQIYTADLQVVDRPIRVELSPGFNLVAVGADLVSRYPTAEALLASGTPPSLERVLTYSARHGRFFSTDQGGGFELRPGMALMLYAGESGSLQVAAAGESLSYTLLPGVNHIGLLSVPFGYRAFDLMRSIGLDAVLSVRRFNQGSGLWESASVRQGAGGPEPVGQNFPIEAGAGLILTMQQRVDGWQP
ncbi:hypothetical protein C2E25_05675 [Geothermobacter hydrogeniphilus]|uniref:FlgD/Vpr Ig-like domain-containing protein n=1 Tax=Geothermobacter hydrogeniphilus TaxID=1969733 RepID=A0A2K2HBV9_9BACT|nr:hypothetical protein C2E25_05675 [Geothermobacter hydrogeniphilus]